jgi:hypothetical protein
MAPHSSPENGISWDDGILEFAKLYQTLNEAVAGYAHLYAYGKEKCRFLKSLLPQPIRNLEDFDCPSPHGLKSQFSSIQFSVTRIPSTSVVRLEVPIHFTDG